MHRAGRFIGMGSLMLGCDTHTERVATQKPWTEPSSTATSGASSLIQNADTTPPLECFGVHEQGCKGACVDVTVDRENCGCCGCACASGERCHQAECEPELTCQEHLVVFSAAELAVDEMVQVDAKSLALELGQEIVIRHDFQTGPNTIVIVARAEPTTPTLALQITSNTNFASVVPVRSRHNATYRVELQGAGVSALTITASSEGREAAQGTLFVERVEIHECEELHRSCPGGGAYIVEASACVPLVCDTPTDCAAHFNQQTSLAECRDGICVYPTCGSDTAGHSVYCLDARQLADPRRNPSSPTVIDISDLSHCPDITELRWIVQEFRGEGSCVYWPICGPGSTAAFGYTPDSARCCYLVGDLCGVL